MDLGAQETQTQESPPVTMEQIPQQPSETPQVPSEQAAGPIAQAMPNDGNKATQGARHGVLSALMPQYQMVQTPQGPKQVQVPTTPGDAFRKILAGALVGMGAGAANPGHPGAGFFGGVGTGATAEINRNTADQQLQRQNANTEFENSQKAQLNQAAQAHLQASTAEATWRAIGQKAEISEKQAQHLNDLNTLVASDESNQNYGSYKSFDEFLDKHKEIAPEIADEQAKGLIQVVPEFSADGKAQTLHIFKINPQWATQKNDKPFTFTVGKQDVTIPAGAMTNGDIAKAQLSLAEKEMQAGLAKTDQGRHIDNYLKANNLPDTPANRLQGENDYIQKTKVNPQVAVYDAKGGAEGKTDARVDKSYQYNDTALTKLETPLDQLGQRMGRLSETLNQATPQADALAAPELLTVMAGGQGSGLRMNEAEISRIVGGRSHLENLKAALQKWSTDPAHANSLTPDQRNQMKALTSAVNTKLQAKLHVLTQAHQKLIDAGDVDTHRKVVADSRNELENIDSGKIPVYVDGKLAGHTTDGGKTMIPAGQ